MMKGQSYILMVCVRLGKNKSHSEEYYAQRTVMSLILLYLSSDTVLYIYSERSSTFLPPSVLYWRRLETTMFGFSSILHSVTKWHFFSKIPLDQETIIQIKYIYFPPWVLLQNMYKTVTASLIDNDHLSGGKFYA